MNTQPRLSFTRPLVVGSVSDLAAWQQACAAESLPCDVVELRADGLPADTDWAALAQMRWATSFWIMTVTSLKQWLESSRVRTSVVM